MYFVKTTTSADYHGHVLGKSSQRLYCWAWILRLAGDRWCITTRGRRVQRAGRKFGGPEQSCE